MPLGISIELIVSKVAQSVFYFETITKTILSDTQFNKNQSPCLHNHDIDSHSSLTSNVCEKPLVSFERGDVYILLFTIDNNVVHMYTYMYNCEH